MALHQTTLVPRAVSTQDLVRVLLVIAAVVALFLVATYVFGVSQVGPSYELTTDPAGVALPF
jgi:hypothetical protein